MLVSFPDCPVSIETYRKCFIFPSKPCIYSQPCHTWGKEKVGESRMVIILEPLLFYTSATLTGRASEASEQRVRNCPAVRLETFVLILPSQGAKDLLATGLYWWCLTWLTLAAFSKWSTLSKTCRKGSLERTVGLGSKVYNTLKT